MAVIIFRNSVKLVGYKSERNVVSPIKAAKRLEQSTAHAGMAGRIGREGRCKVGTIEVAGWSAQGRKRRIADSCSIVVSQAARTTARIRFANTGNWTPNVM